MGILNEFVTTHQAWLILDTVLGDRMWSLTRLYSYLQKVKIERYPFGSRTYYKIDELLDCLPMPKTWIEEVKAYLKAQKTAKGKKVTM